MIDRTTFTNMYENFDKEVIDEIIEIFIREYPTRIKELEKDIQAHDFDSLAKHAHSIKGVIANFYDEDARQMAFQLEKKGKSLDSSGLDEDLLLLKKACEHLMAELNEIRKNYR